MGRHIRFALVIAACVPPACIDRAWGRQERPPTDPAPEASPGAPERAAPRERGKPAPLRPTRPDASEPARPEDALDRSIVGGPRAGGASEGRLLREGTFVVRRRGTMVPLGGGRSALVFHREAGASAERPMVLLPSQHLARMEQMAAAADGSAVFLVTGEVFAYQGRNYLLPTVTPSAVHRPSTDGADAEARAGELDPESIGAILADLKREEDRPRSIEVPPSTGDPGTEPSAAKNNLLGEGTLIVRRRGRLVRLGIGEWAVAFDNDSDAAATPDAPMPLVPCLNLERLDAMASASGGELDLEISGRVLTYGGRNYLIPMMFQRLRRADIAPRQ